jgi:predicted SAM-dependent methyltransferase
MNNFVNYAKLVDASQPQSVSLSVAKVSDDLLFKVKNAIESGEIVETSIIACKERLDDHLLLMIDTHSDQTEEQLNANQTVLSLHRFNSTDSLLRELHNEVRDLFSADIGSPFVIVNSRMWKTHPLSEAFGPNDFHTDGLSPGHLKVMIYVTKLSVESGYFEFKDGSTIKQLVNLPAGTAVLFRNSDIIHRGVPGTVESRISIEITLMRATVNHDQAWQGSFYGRHLVEPTIFHHFNPYDENLANSSLTNFAKISTGSKVNIGSGRRDWSQWLCLDELEHPGVRKIVFSPQVSLPLDNQSVSLFYSSHCFEHLDDETLNQILKEMHRAAKTNAILVLKIPDYDYFLRQFKSGISTSMNGKGVESVLRTWQGRITDNFLNRLSMMFCGYWNKAYGDHFTGNVLDREGAYHGPAIVDEDSLRTIFELESPRKIVEHLRKIALQDPEFFRFNHQNAWSRNEMVHFLFERGFEVFSTESSLIVQRFRENIPDIDSMQTWSSYYLARKV